jgi:N-acetyl-gamma-glutamyl-phosphate reductase
LPADAAMRAAPDFLATGAVVIDLSAAFRLLDPQVYARWYKEEHVSAQLLPEAVYGLVEHERERIRTARLIANPGCYPTSALLPLLPFVKAGVLESGPVIVDSKSGVSGMGRKVAPESTFMEINENFRAYGVGTHRHTPEIAQELAKQAGNDVPLVFTPHLLPLTRGILSTIYIRTALDVGACNSLLADAYRDEPFVLAGDGVLPETAKVSGTNLCHCSAFPTNAPGTVVLISAIDNLVKGAAGQAVQNLNTRFGFPETAALV